MLYTLKYPLSVRLREGFMEKSESSRSQFGTMEGAYHTKYEIFFTST